MFHGSVDGLEAAAGSGAASNPFRQPSLTVGAATGQTSYRIGQPIRSAVTETNTGPNALGVGVCGPSPVTITRQAIEVWRMPDLGVCPALALLLQPGQSRQYTVLWPGRFTEHTRLPRTGQFVVHATIDGTLVTTGFRIVR